MNLRIAHLYPEVMNLYGDKGNLIALQRRCGWRGISCTISAVGLGDPFRPDLFDLVFIGGGQNHEQDLLQSDLKESKASMIRQAVEEGMVFLCICGGYQMMGHYFEQQNGERIPGIGALDLFTIDHPDRLTGDLICKSDELAEKGLDELLVGFENHSGRTWLGPSVKPLATVIIGQGNNGVDQTEGAIYKNVFCTYAHGSFLPKNPDMTDHLIELAIRRRDESFPGLQQLDNTFENKARDAIMKSCGIRL